MTALGPYQTGVRHGQARAVNICKFAAWSEQRHHLAGPLGTALADRLFALGWVRRTQRRRVVQVTELGQRKLPAVLGLPADWAQPAGDAWLSGRAAS